ncbi:MAG: 23S rRNA (uracil(1939)-C(5))-methyltransferase RlmD [Desulforhopalus sp.]|nr:23S rRNA (uracil(1939)-C(5))-methyltransferase RlmD [Desulforhopalus sp.]
MQLEPLVITKIINGGFGLGSLSSGQVVLVRHVLPGETVIVRIEEQKKNYLIGQVEKIIEAHPARRIPPCPYAGSCGGCDLQHTDYTTQLLIKKAVITDLLERSIPEALPLLAEPIAAPEEFGYRQRLRLQVYHGELGFHRFQSHDLLPVKSCMLAGVNLNHCLAALRSMADGRKLTALATEVELQENPQSGKAVVIFHLSRKPRPADIQAARRFGQDVDNVERIFFAGQQFSLMGPYGRVENEGSGSILGVHYQNIPGLAKDLHLCWEAGGFCQVNLQQNSRLIAEVLDFCQVENGHKLLDLYCGMGNFAIPLAQGGAEVLGIEGQGSAIRSAKKNEAMAGLTHVQFRQSPIEAACTDLAAGGAFFDCVVIDPPRQGAPGLASLLATLTKKRLVAISCDPATLCRDLAQLIEHGFVVRKIQPIDMFPQTHHLETVVLLEKSGC